MAQERQRQVVAACCEIASAAGVRPGMAVAEARAILPPAVATSLRVESVQPQRTSLALRALALWAQRFSPRVAVDEPDGLLLDIAGCAHLFGGEAGLAARVVQRCRALGFTARVAIAATFAGAWALARFGEAATTIVPDDPAALRSALAALPLRALGIADKVVVDLAEVGVDRIGQIIDLPRTLLPARFGDALLLRLDCALGRAIEVIECVRHVEPLRLERCFDGPTAQWEVIEITVRGLLAELAEALRTLDCGARRVEVTLVGADRAPSTTIITLGHPSRDARHLWTLLRPRLERVELESATGFGIDAVIVAAPVLGRLPHAQGRLGDGDGPGLGEGMRQDGGAALERRASELLDILANRLGAERVLRAEIVESHRPERAARFLRFDADGGAGRAQDVQRDRPTILLEAPERLQEVNVEAVASGPMVGGWATGGPAASEPVASGRVTRSRAVGDASADELVGAPVVGAPGVDGPGVDCPVVRSRAGDDPDVIAANIPAADHPPPVLRWRGRPLRIVAAVGPERIAPEWWRTDPDGASTRDYFAVQEAGGRWLWIFHDELAGCWFLHGAW